ncbi:MAG: HAMP domain-containing histidine kinase [Spirochaetes bacterium]|nr:HAMP domain-containing histidine kinase [Spirochaetota bacterium]
MEYRIADSKEDFNHIDIFYKHFFPDITSVSKIKSKEKNKSEGRIVHFIAVESDKVYAYVRLIKGARTNPKSSLPIENHFNLSLLKKNNLHPVEFSQLIVSNQLNDNNILTNFLIFIFKYIKKMNIKYLCTIANTGTDDSRSVRIIYRIAEIKNLIHPDLTTLPLNTNENNDTPRFVLYDNNIIKQSDRNLKLNYKSLQILEKKGFQLPLNIQFYIKLGFKITSIPTYINEFQKYVIPMFLEVEKSKIKNLKNEFKQESSLVTNKEINCRSANAIIQYVKHHNGDIHKLLKGINFSEEFLTDENNWMDCKTIIDLFRNAKLLLKDNNIGYNIGQASTKENTVGIINLLYKLFSNPLLTFKMVPKMLEFWDRVQSASSKIINKNKVEITLSKGPVIPSKDICEWNRGIFISIPEIWNLKTTALETKCVRKGDQRCTWEIEWEPQKSFFKRLYYSTFVKLKTIIETKKIVKEKYNLLEKKYKELRLKTQENIALNNLLSQKNIELQRVINSKIKELEKIYKKKLNKNKVYLSEERDYIKENFAGIIAHEIKSSTSSINILYNNLKRENILDENQSILIQLVRLSKNKINKNRFANILNRIEIINNNYKDITYTINSTSSIIQESLNISKSILNNYHETAYDIQSIKSIIQEYVDNRKSYLKQYDIAINLTINNNLKKKFNRQDILMLINNIVNNSFNVLKTHDQNKNKKIDIRVNTNRYKKIKNIVISIQDNGPGIPVKHRHEIFNPFFSTSAKNLGLGLTFCRKIIKKYNGDIQFSSNLNNGTVFKIYLPIV